MKIQATRKSFEMQVNGGKASSSASEAAAAALAGPDSSTKLGTQTTSSSEATEPQGAAFDGAGNKERKDRPSPDRNDDDVAGEGLAEEQRRLEEQDKLEHEARMAELDRYIGCLSLSQNLVQTDGEWRPPTCGYQRGGG